MKNSEQQEEGEEEEEEEVVVEEIEMPTERPSPVRRMKSSDEEKSLLFSLFSFLLVFPPTNRWKLPWPVAREERRISK